MAMAQKIPQSLIDTLLDRIDIVTLIGEYIPLQAKGQNHIACCPFHKEKTPSFSVSQPKQFYHCFGCKKSGNAITFLIDYEHLSFQEAITKLAHRTGIRLTTSSTGFTDEPDPILKVQKAASYYYQQCLKQPAHSQAVTAYLKQRGLTELTTETFQLGYAPPAWDGLAKQLKQQGYSNTTLQRCGLLVTKDNRAYDRFRDRLMFPIRNFKGQTIGFGGRVISTQAQPKYLNSPETEIFKKNEVLYGVYEMSQHRTKADAIIVVEGYMDVIALQSHGLTHVVGTLGTAISRHHIQQLKKFSEKIIFCFDGDSAGLHASWKALTTCLPFYTDNLEIQFCLLPEGSDPDHYIRQHGQAKFLALLQQAIPISEYLFTHHRSAYSIDAKAQMAEQLLPLIQSMPDNTKRKLLLRKLSHLAQLDFTSPPQTVKVRSMLPKGRLLPPSIFLKLSAILVQNPALVVHLEDLDSTLSLADQDFQTLTRIVQVLKNYRPQTTGQLLSHPHPEPDRLLIQQFATIDLALEPDQLVDEVKSLIKITTDRLLTNEINALLTKGNVHGLKEQEMISLHTLISKQKLNKKTDQIVN